MAYELLKTFIESIVKANGNEEITGTNMQAVLKQIVDIVGAAEFRGVASPETNPGGLEGFASYITGTAGTYVNFGNIELTQGELATLRWTGAAWVKETIQSYISDIFVRDYYGVPFIQNLIKVKGTQEEIVTILQKANGFVIPGIVNWSGDGFIFNVSYTIYLLNSIPFAINNGYFTLDPADPEFDRIDVIAVNDQGEREVLKGTPGVSPIKPQVNYHQLELTYILVKAGSVTPEIEQLIVWNENTESVGSADLINADFDNTNFPKIGLKAVNASAVQGRGWLKFTLPEVTKIDVFKSISLYLRLKVLVPAEGKIYVQFFNDDNAISDQQPFSFESSFVNEYQFLALSLDVFRFTTLDFNSIKIQYVGPNFNGFYLDYIKLEGGIGIPSVNEYLGWYFDTLTENGIVRTFIRSGENAFFKAKEGSRIKLTRASHNRDGNVLEFDFDEEGLEGLTPYIGGNGNWWIGDIDTGVQAAGIDGITPHIGGNNNWWIGDVDTGIKAEGIDGLDGIGVPAGGTTGQVLKKLSNDDYNTGWQDESGGSGGSTQLTAIPATDKTASGITTQFTANEAQVFGDVVRINSAGKAQLAKADVIANATALAMCISEVVEADATGNYMLIGFARDDAWDWIPGGEIYLSLTGTSGNTLTQTSPFTADPIVEDTVVQLLGVANTADSFYFNPQLVQVELKPN